MRFLSDSQFRQMLRDGEALGIPKATTYLSLKSKGYEIEGEPPPKRMSSQNVSPAVVQDFMDTDTSKMGHIQRTLVNAEKGIVGGGRTIIDRVVHPAKLLTDVRDMAKSTGQLISGTGQNIYEGITGNKVPVFKPGGTFGEPDAITPNIGPTEEQQVANAVGQSIVEGVKHPIQTFENHPIATTFAIYSAGKSLMDLTGATEKMGHSIARRQAESAVRDLQSSIDDGIAKGIKPSVSGKTTASQLAKATEQQREAVIAIAGNKPNLSLVDEFGDSLPQGTLPKSLSQFSQALDQTKKQIFKQYDSLKTAAGEAGASVDLLPTVNELDKIVNDPIIRDLSPDVADYATRRMRTLSKRGLYSAEEAQDAIAHLNGSLEAYYRNPSPATFGSAKVDALIANNIRDGLDASITAATGPGYADLKMRYGALKSIEKDLTKRVVIEGRKNAKGLLDFTDVFSAGDVVAGITTGNPMLVAKGAAQKSVASYFKYLNSPDQAIKRMFQRVDMHLSTMPQKLAPFPELYNKYGPKPKSPSDIMNGMVSEIGGQEAARIAELNKTGLPETTGAGYPIPSSQ